MKQKADFFLVVPPSIIAKISKKKINELTKIDCIVYKGKQDIK